jgi:hypothetical protein
MKNEPTGRGSAQAPLQRQAKTMNLESTKLGKAIAIAVSACFLVDTAMNIAFAVRDGSTELIGGFVFSLTLFIVLYVSFWRAKEWARYLLGFLLVLRCGVNLRGLFGDASTASPFSTVEIVFCLLFGGLGIAILAVPGVRNFLRNLNSPAPKT